MGQGLKQSNREDILQLCKPKRPTTFPAIKSHKLKPSPHHFHPQGADSSWSLWPHGWRYQPSEQFLRQQRLSAQQTDTTGNKSRKKNHTHDRVEIWSLSHEDRQVADFTPSLSRQLLHSWGSSRQPEREKNKESEFDHLREEWRYRLSRALMQLI